VDGSGRLAENFSYVSSATCIGLVESRRIVIGLSGFASEPQAESSYTASKWPALVGDERP